MKSCYRMRLALLGGVVLCGSAGLILARVAVLLKPVPVRQWQAKVQERVPRLTLSRREVHFGVVDQQSVTSTTVALRNDGGSTLIIEAVQRGGCCTPSGSALRR